MSTHSATDFFGYLLIRLIGPLVRLLPIGLALWLGRRIGEAVYCVDRKHRAQVFVHIKSAMGDELSLSQVSRVTLDFYRSFGQSIIDIFMLPLVDQRYMEKYIHFEGREYLEKARAKGKGVIIAVVHEGSWELSNIVCANLGLPFIFFMREQRHVRLSAFLNSYRVKHGCKIIDREDDLRTLIEHLKNNWAVAMTIDQGGKDGIPVQFFGRTASLSQGVIRLALKFGCAIVPAFSVRERGPHMRFFVEPEFSLRRSGNTDEDVRVNLQKLIHLFERYIRRYPHEYLWTYKLYKYGLERQILILSDGKTGHLRQAQAVAGALRRYLGEKGINAEMRTIEVTFSRKHSSALLIASAILANGTDCQRCAWCLRSLLSRETLREIERASPHYVVSGGSSLAGLNLIVSGMHKARSIAVMRPSVLSTRRFDLVVMPAHDKPPRRRNVVVTTGALNVADPEYVQAQAHVLRTRIQLDAGKALTRIGVLLGGDTKEFRLEPSLVAEVCAQVRQLTVRLHAEYLFTTSRRTSPEAEAIVKQACRHDPACKLMVIANEENIPETVGGILGASDLLIVSPESISMISEAASSGRYTLVFRAGVSEKHARFLSRMSRANHITLCDATDLAEKAASILMNRPPIEPLNDLRAMQEGFCKAGF